MDHPVEYENVSYLALAYASSARTTRDEDTHKIMTAAEERIGLRDEGQCYDVD